MKKIGIILLCVSLLMVMTACGNSGGQTPTETNSSPSSGTADNTIQTSDSDAQYSTSIDSLGSSNGFFRLNRSADTITSFWNQAGHSKVAEFDGKEYGYLYDEGAYLCTGSKEPMMIDVSSGENMIIVETQYNYSPEEINLYPLSVVGYGNEAVLDNLKPERIEEIQGIDISSMNSDIDALNQALSGTGIRYYPYTNSSGYDYGVFLSGDKNSMFEYAWYEGTQYKFEEAEMYYTYYLAPLKDEVQASVEKTTNGYFVVDLSNVPKGEYLVYEEYYGWYLIDIQ